MPDPWPHAPPHWTFSPGIYFVTASTWRREHFFREDEHRQIVQQAMLNTAAEHGWTMKAWVVLSNHYHLLAESPESGGETLGNWLRNFHRSSAREVNILDNALGRRIWMNFRETHITHQTSFLARLNYIHKNPVKHGLVATPDQYRWSSFRWFSSNAPVGFVESVSRFGTDRLNVWDEF